MHSTPLIDPRIQADVQRALKLKARREARLRAQQSSPLSFNSIPQSDGGYSTATSPMMGYAASTSMAPTSTSYTTPSLNSAPASIPKPPAVGTEVDFSPSVRPAPEHPVPISFNEGATLDWGSILSDDEKGGDRKWLHLRKRHKDKARAGEPVVEQQDSVYTGMYFAGAMLQILKSLCQTNLRESRLKPNHILSQKRL